MIPMVATFQTSDRTRGTPNAYRGTYATRAQKYIRHPMIVASPHRAVRLATNTAGVFAPNARVRPRVVPASPDPALLQAASCPMAPAPRPPQAQVGLGGNDPGSCAAVPAAVLVEASP